MLTELDFDIPHSQFPIPHSPFPITYYQLTITSYQFPILDNYTHESLEKLP